jgi:DNA repair protein RadC
VRYQRAELPLKLDCPAAALEFFAGCFAEQDPRQESLWVAHLDRKARCLHLSHYNGDASGLCFPMRAIILDAARHGSAGILLVHNHPSGDPRPSESDLRSTRRLASAAKALECSVIDHFVFAGPNYTSLRELGYL